MTTLTATPDTATASVVLEVADSPVDGAVLTEDDFAGGDAQGWTAHNGNADSGYMQVSGQADGTLLIGFPYGNDPNVTWAESVLNVGPVAGQRYRITARCKADPTPGSVAVGFASAPDAPGEPLAPFVFLTDEWTDIEAEFVATGSGQVRIYDVSGNPFGLTVSVDYVRLQPAAGPTTITRTDLNGTAPVRLAGQQPVAGAMTVVDYEAALTGELRYDLVDDDGTVTATTALDGTAPDGTVTVRENLCRFPSAEGAGGVTGWSASGGTLSATTYPPFVAEGVTAYVFNATGGGVVAYAFLDDYVAVAPGQWVGLELGDRLSGGISHGRLRLIFRDDAEADVGQAETPIFKLQSNAEPPPLRYRVVGQAPAGTTKVRAIVLYYDDAAGSAPEAGAVAGFDAVHIVTGPTSAAVHADLDLGFFDGSTPPAGDLTYAWQGPANASVSQERRYTYPAPVVQPWLGVPVRPQLGVELYVLRDYDESRDNSGNLHHVILAGYPVPVVGPTRARTGSLAYRCRSYPEAQRVVDVYALGEVVQLRQPDHPGMDMYHVAEQVGVRRDGEGWAVTARYAEVAAPLDEVLP